MAVLLAEYRVNDYGTYKTVFDEFAPVRREMGATGHRLMRAADQLGIVVLLVEFATLDGARAFAADPRRLDLLDRAGVIERRDIILEDMDLDAY
jgi:hypothetical protein